MARNRQEIGRFIIVYGGLAAFGVVYNKAVEWIDDHQLGHPYTSLFVAVGTAVTVAASIPLVGRKCAAVILGAFIASGSPMIAGSIQRWMQREMHGQEVLDAYDKAKGKGQKRTTGYEAAKPSNGSRFAPSRN